MAAFPKRWPVVVAKVVIVAVIAGLIGLVVLFSGFAIASAIVPTSTPVGLTEPGVFAALLGRALFQTSAAVITDSLTALVDVPNQLPYPASITAIVAWTAVWFWLALLATQRRDV